MRHKSIIKGILYISILIFFNIGLENVKPLEEYGVLAGYGADMEGVSANVQYSVPFSVYNFGGEEPKTKIKEAKGKNIAETRETRQLISDKLYLLGVQRLLILSEKKAETGIKNEITILFNNPQINDRGVVVVCKGKSEDILMHKVEGYASSGEYIEGMVRNAVGYNFFADEYSLMDIYVRLESEGRSLVLPYIELKNNIIRFTGTSIFNGYNMIGKLDIEDSKIMNILREDGVGGILTIQKSLDKYINYKAKSDRKVKCEKKGENYIFTIDLNFYGDIIVNTLYKDINKNNLKEFELIMSRDIEKMCYSFIDKMKNVYKVDCLELGKYAVAKYGRDTGVDWNKVVCNSDIKVNVKVKVDKLGRGGYE